MSLLSLVLTLVVIGLVLWAINTYVPLDPAIKRILNIAVIVLVILWLVYSLGATSYLAKVKV